MQKKNYALFSHTHGGPNDSLEEEWSLDVHYQICQAIHQAQTEWTPVYGGWANAYSDIGLNRRKDSNFWIDVLVYSKYKIQRNTIINLFY